MNRFGYCELGCSERRRDLVRAVAYDVLVAAEDAARMRIEVLAPVLEHLLGADPTEPGWEAVYRQAQAQARQARRSAARVDQPTVDLSEAAEAATTWWCAECGAIDSPQPCLGICVWREVEWVDRDVYDRGREQTIAVLNTERRLQGLVRSLAWSTPRENQWERSWDALRSQAAELAPAARR